MANSSVNGPEITPDYLGQISPEYLEVLLEQYETSPETLPMSWRLFFDGVAMGQAEGASTSATATSETTAKGKGAPERRGSDLERNITRLIEGYRVRGHLSAQLDPLGRSHFHGNSRLELGQFGLAGANDKQKFEAAKELGLPSSSLKDIVSHLQKTYCRSVGIEYTHISDEKARAWLEKRMEPAANSTLFSADEKKQFLTDVAEATLLEDFLQKSFTGQKRFSVEGAESVIAGLKQIIRRIAAHGAKELVIGMAHRGRLNVLVNVMQKPPENLFSEFFGTEFESDFEGSGDVKYHMGFSSDVDVNGQEIHMSLGFNPSHLETIDPVVEGMTFAKQHDKYNGDFDSIVPLLIHGDAAVIGQGVVCETLNFSKVDGYCTGGTLHIVINNQIGFTTYPEESRSTLYCTDFAKATQSPILHVNGDDVEAVIHAVTLAADFRKEFHRDVFVDIFSYRKYGHNEGDEPRFTQPNMYDIIGKKPNTFEVYRDKLIAAGVVDSTTSQKIHDEIWKRYDEALTSVKTNPKKFSIESLGKNWGGLRAANEEDMTTSFRAPLDKSDFDEIVESLHHVPDTVKPLPKFKRMLDNRMKKINETGFVDWAVAEQLAFGSLLKEGFGVRLSGQDCKRGTFSHRHYEFNDATGTGSHIPLKKFESENNKINVYNSPLSEYGILGFDFGYASASPRTLTIWEAQFGDFANGAQIMIDQFISSTESKWRRMNGIVLLLPHGYEGQGPEHSSARLERFLQLAGQANMQVCYPTMPAQLFHLLRRQVMRDFRKPLIIMSPKSPLRMPEVISSVHEVCNGEFQNVIVSGAEAGKAKRLVLCSGKVYWDLVKAAKEKGLDDKVAFARVEQIYPLDKRAMNTLKDQFKNVKKWIWCQEEPKNMGAWAFMKLETLEMGLDLSYAGREASASPATGSPKIHNEELAAFLKTALEG